jgi:hypothetical protein
LGSSFVSPTSLLFPFFLSTLQTIPSDPITNTQSVGELNTNHEDKDNEGNINISSCNPIIGAQDVGVYRCTNSGSASNGSSHG